MMDQGSGNLGALVPALPDAWSRVFMGWEDAGYVFPNADTAAVIITHALQRFNPASTGGEIIKIPVTQREYYLLENRDADADSLGHVSLFDRDGREMQVATDGTVSISAGFQSAVRASHYDFGIPGSGILIWHIDEDVIEANLETNSVNANPDHRGVDLVEADGAQDIGEEYGFASAGSGAELGIQEDAWYLGNEAYRAANGGALLIRFSDRSLPSARLYDGAYTYLELTNFSAVSDSMTFRARSTTIMPGYPVSVPAVEFPQWSVADLNGDGVREVITLADSRIDVFNMSGQQVGTIQIAEDQDLPRAYNTGYDLDGDGREELPLGGENAVLLRMVDSTLTLTVGPRHEDIHSDVSPARTIEGTPVLLERRIHVFVIYSLSLDSLYSFTVPGTEFGGVNVVNIESLPSTQFALVAEASVHAIELRDAMPVQLWQIDVAADGFASVVAEPDLRTVFINNYGYVRADDGTLLCSTDDCDWPHIDWDGDGIPEGGGRFGRNEVPTENPLHYGGQAAWTDFDVDGRPDQLTLSEIELGPGSFGAPTRMHVARHDGALFPGFPLAASALDPNAMNGLDMTPDNSLYFVSMYGQSGDYRLALNKFPITAGSGERFPYTEDVRIINVGPLNPQVHARADWLYCWPNPTSDESHIRITLSYAAHANVKVFDIAGRQVAELSGASTLPGPFEVLWDVSNVESGVYIGQVTTKGDGGEEQAQVKIAVVR